MNGAASVTIGSQFTVNFLDRSRWEAGCTKGAPMVPFGRCRLLAEDPVGRPRVGHGVTASSVSEMCPKAISRNILIAGGRGGSRSRRRRVRNVPKGDIAE